MPGMLRHATGPHPSGPQGPRTERWDEDADFIVGWSDTDWLPDLTDPATLGCLLSLLRGAWDDPLAHLVILHTNDWSDGPGSDLAPASWWALALGGDVVPTHVDSGNGYYLAGPTEAEALVAALEAAP